MTLLKVKISENTRKRLRICGVTPGLLRDFELELSEHLTPIDFYTKDGKRLLKRLHAREQTNTIKRLAKSKFDWPFTICINATHEFLKARQLGLFLFKKALDKTQEDQEKYRGNLPTWHYLTAGFDDKLVKDYKNVDASQPPLLVLDGFDTAMSAHKLDKARDLINIYNDRPRIILISGNEAVKFVGEQLYTKVDGWIKFSHVKQDEQL